MTEYFDDIHHDSGIHQIVWNDVGQDSTKKYVELYNNLVENCPENGTLRILHDYRNKVAPAFNAMTRGMNDMIVRDDVKIRIAHIYSEAIYPMIVKNASLVARFNAERKFFKADEEEQAIAWLLEEPQSQ